MEIIYSILGITAGVLVLIRKYREYFIWRWCCSQKRMDGKVVIITGGNSGIGKETAKDLANRGALVILACRNREAAIEAIHWIRSCTANGDVVFIELDLADLASVKKCADNILEKFSHIDVLVNNAGVSIPPDVGSRTTDGIEIHFGVNHLGHFYLTQLLLDRIKETDNSRIVTVSSMLYRKGKINYENLNGERQIECKKYDNPLYSASKLANILHAQDLHRRLTGTGVGVYALCPGFINSGLMRHYKNRVPWIMKLCFLPVAFLFMRSCKQGAQTTIHCAISEELNSVPFGFYRNCKPSELSSDAQDGEAAAKLHTVSRELVTDIMGRKLSASSVRC